MRYLAVCLTIFACMLPAPSFAGMAALNPAFVEWQAEREVESVSGPTSVRSTQSETRALGRRPSPINRNHMLDLSVESVSTPEGVRKYTVPTASQYDLRDYGYVTAVKDQDPYGTCWAFAAVAAGESSALKKGLSSVGYSEKHLAYFGYTDVDDDFVAFDRWSQPAPDSVYDLGGLDDVAAAILTRWTGYVSETDEPYENMGPCEGDTSLPAGIAPSASASNAALLMGIYYAPGGKSVVGNIKYFIKRYGAVTIGVCWRSKYYDSSTNGFYAYNKETSNHAVTVVGWDDTYAKENFRGEQPDDDGAWIVRNSWGDSWGDDGYFYVSYEDYTVSKEGAYAYEAAEPVAGRKMYMYDPLGFDSAYSVGSNDARQWAANVFTASGDDVMDQVLVVTTEMDVKVRVYVYSDLSDYSDPTSGTLVYEGSAVTLPFSGYHTLDLDSSVQLDRGKKFSVVVQYVGSGDTELIPVEMPLEYETSKATASSGESFVSADGSTWIDLTTQYDDTNVCLRAIVDADTSALPSVMGVKLLLMDN